MATATFRIWRGQRGAGAYRDYSTEIAGGMVVGRLTGRPVLSSVWERDGALAHVHLAHDAELVIVAPATAHLIARMAQGLADDLLTTLLLARTGPVGFLRVTGGSG